MKTYFNTIAKLKEELLVAKSEKSVSVHDYYYFLGRLDAISNVFSVLDGFPAEPFVYNGNIYDISKDDMWEVIKDGLARQILKTDMATEE